MVTDLLRKAARRLSGSSTPMLDARVLLAHCAEKDDAAMIFDMPSEDRLALFEECLARREKGEPVAYIIGEKEFMGLRFTLNRDTLIPRPDTECLVENVLGRVKDGMRVLDLCTGSGCIGISIAHFVRGAYVTLTDIADGALSAAKRNAALNGVADRAEVKRLDVLSESIAAGYNVITANPPYIQSDIARRAEVSRFEPMLALDGGADGLVFYREIIKKAYCALADGGVLALEIGYDQAHSVCEAAREFSAAEIYRDYGGNDRAVILTK